MGACGVRFRFTHEMNITVCLCEVRVVGLLRGSYTKIYFFFLLTLMILGVGPISCGKPDVRDNFLEQNSNLELGCFDIGGQRHRFFFEKFGMNARFGEDMLLPLDRVLDCEKESQQGLSSPFWMGNSTNLYLWRNRRIPFVLPEGFPYRSELEISISDWKKAGISWEPKADSDKDYVNFVIEPRGGPNIKTACGVSYMGKIGGVQNLWLRSKETIGNCQSLMTKVVIHEMGHAMGFLHEHQRSDRDKFIKFSFDTSNDSNLSVITSSINHTTFDVASIMIYSSYQISGLTKLDGSLIATPTRASEKDIEGAIKLYENKAPIFGVRSFVTAREDTSVEILVEADDIDNTLSCSSVHWQYSSSNTSLVASNGGVSWSGDWPRCASKVTPVINASGVVTLTYVLSDGALAYSKNVILNIASENDSPSVGIISNQVTPEDTPVEINLIGNDVDGTLSCTISHWNYASSDNNIVAGSGAVSWGGTWPNCVARVTPVANASGSVSLTFTLSDGRLADSKSFTLDVSAENDSPMLGNISEQSTKEDVIVEFPLKGLVDVDSDLSCTSQHWRYSSTNESIVAATGAVSWSGTWPNCTSSVRPVANAFGSVTLSYTLSDGSISVSTAFLLRVEAVNDPIYMVGIPDQMTVEDATKSIMVLLEDLDGLSTCSDSSLSYLSSDSAVVAESGAVSWSGVWPTCEASVTPRPNSSGNTQLTFYLSDGQETVSRMFNFNVSSVNDAPTIAGLDELVTSTVNTAKFLKFNIYDLDNNLSCSSEHLSYTSNNPSVVAESGAVRWLGIYPECVAEIIPAENAVGSAVVKFFVTDGSLSASQSFRISFSDLRESPLFSGLSKERKLLSGSSLEIPLSLISGLKSTLSGFNCAELFLISTSAPMVISAADFSIEGDAPNCIFKLKARGNAKGSAWLTMGMKVGQEILSHSVKIQVSLVTAVVKVSSFGGKAPVWIDFSGVDSIAQAGSKVESWEWHFGDDTFGSAANFAKSYTVPGDYEISLKVVDSRGYEDVEKVNITITE